MSDPLEIYLTQAETYDELIRYEDYTGNLLTEIKKIFPSLKNMDVIECGAGTGRLTILLSPIVRSISAFDITKPMLDIAKRSLEKLKTSNWTLGVADNSKIPLPDESADVSIAGWTFGHQTVWNKDSWKMPIEMAIREMLRVLRPNGKALIIETLGTDILHLLNHQNSLNFTTKCLKRNTNSQGNGYAPITSFLLPKKVRGLFDSSSATK